MVRSTSATGHNYSREYVSCGVGFEREVMEKNKSKKPRLIYWVVVNKHDQFPALFKEKQRAQAYKKEFDLDFPKDYPHRIIKMVEVYWK